MQSRQSSSFVRRLRSVIAGTAMAFMLAPFMSAILMAAGIISGQSTAVYAAVAPPPAGTHCGDKEQYDDATKKCFIALPASGQCPRAGMTVVAGTSNNICRGDPLPGAATGTTGATGQQPPTITNDDFTITSKCPKGDCIFAKYINPAVNTLSAIVGVAVTISIVVAGIRYSTSADSPQKVSEAKQRMLTSILVLIGYFTFYAFLNFLLPVKLI